jgi:hypothetical protein
VPELVGHSCICLLVLVGMSEWGFDGAALPAAVSCALSDRAGLLAAVSCMLTAMSHAESNEGSSVLAAVSGAK